MITFHIWDINRTEIIQQRVFGGFFFNLSICYLLWEKINIIKVIETNNSGLSLFSFFLSLLMYLYCVGHMNGQFFLIILFDSL